MTITKRVKSLAAMLVLAQLGVVAEVPLAQASMVATGEVLQAQQQQVDREQLLKMLDDQGVQKKLQSMGVERSKVEQRIKSLSNEELAQFNQQLDQAPAGGIIGIILLFLLIFVITDMLCITHIFTFVRCQR
ncbi:PA2779 family protein [Pseudomonas sp. LA21]|uniref:PA2779 family protein n=2 Tax=Pseudomonas TaxID=286 RepID=UPI001A9D0EFF|nr:MULTISPECIES: PA2779 family protein [unclassified Pseudomonas]MCJ1887374.1 PA2779 family protein [Pseudomonas sp. LA21]WEJ70564.1 PA2779 family protein [Pseudomonas sp. PSE14]